MVRLPVVGAALLIGVLGSSAVRAESSSEDQAAAESLFMEGKKLVAQGKFPEACAKFAQSQHFDAGVGTLLNLADCYEKNQQTASAWAAYKEAIMAARSAAQPAREKMAQDHATALEPKLAKLAIEVSPEAASSVTDVKRDGTPIAKAVWGIALPVDPGDHVVEASGPGRKLWSTHIVAVGAQSVTVKVPALEADIATAAAPPASSPNPAPSAATTSDSGNSKGQRTIALVVGGVGVVALGVAGAFALGAKSTYDKADCHDGNECTQAGYTDRRSAISSARTATIITGIGAAALVGGVVLWLTAPSSRTALAAEPSVGATGANLSLRGTW
jgi:hypothetical protein